MKKTTKVPKVSGEKPMRCDYYNRTECLSTGRGCGDEPRLCPYIEGNDSKSTLCYALWQNTSSSGLQTEFKGCWVGSTKDCAHKSNCIENRKETKKQLFFCCCDGDLCNTNITHIPSPLLQTTTTTESSPMVASHPPLIIIFPLITLFMFLLLVIGFSYKYYRKKCGPNEVPMSTDPLIGPCSPSPYVGLRPIRLMEVKAQGKFGHVWKAKDGSDNLVAVKVFGLQDRQSWQTEQAVYLLPQMTHKNLLTYLGAERKGEGLATEYWLITEYQPNGSLWEYLKANTVTWSQMLNIAQGIARGMPLESSIFSQFGKYFVFD